jgi:tetratricopeptide (TPR) repeat protein
MVKIFSDWDWKGAVDELKKAIDKSPDSWEAYDSYCQLMWAMGRMDESIAAGEKAVALDPEAHFAHCDLSWAYYFADRGEMARAQLKKTKSKFQFECPYHEGLSNILEIEDSIDSGGSLIPIIARLEEAFKDSPKMGSDVYGLLGRCYALNGDLDKAMEIANQPDVSEISKALIYLALDQKEEALDFLERAFLQRSFALMYIIKITPWFDSLRSNPRFVQLLDRMGLSEEALQRTD